MKRGLCCPHCADNISHFHGEESLRVNLNALGDSVVSFAVLALSASPDGSMVAACTDRSRVIVLQVGWGLGIGVVSGETTVYPRWHERYNIYIYSY